MGRCSRCGTETELYNDRIALCVKCSDLWEAKRKPPTQSQNIRNLLLQDLVSTTARNSAALREFEEVMGQFPSGLPHPDGVQRIKNASREVTVARMDMLRAHHRLSDFLNAGIVPDDLKRNG